ncbi:hypothetical protein PG997_011630 [Apiospora hydei]|uniref:Helicase C-terminal domain-containing protein n=1 Tax=Apiospora hydei TaxID=1337664 RepID=A0ABR1VJV5_9PEZI
MAGNGGADDAGTPVPGLERLVASTEALKISAEALQKSAKALEKSAGASSREYNHVYLRIRGRNQDLNQYFEAWLSQFMGNNEGELPGGNVNWPALKSWVVTSINAAVGQRVRLGEIENTVIYALDPTEKIPRIAIDQWSLIALLVKWKQGEELLVDHYEMPHIEFESTKLLRREGLLVIESIEALANNQTPDEGPNPRDRREPDVSVHPEEDPALRETPISTEDADKRTRVLQLVSDQDKNRKLNTLDYWRRVCDLFQRKSALSYRPFNIPGIRRPIDAYQAAAAVWLLTRYAEDRIAGPMLADDPGMGKSTTTIVAIVVHKYLQELFEDVKKFQKKAESEYKHNSKGANKQTGIVDCMENWPSIIICLPQQGIASWTSEWDKTVNEEDSGLRLYVNIDKHPGGSLLEHFIEHIEGLPMPEAAAGLLKKDLPFARSTAGFEFGSAHVLLTANSHVKKLTDPSDKSGFVQSLQKSDGETYLVPVTGCAILAFDEMHKYKGSENKTYPFTLLDILGKPRLRPTLAVGVSGSLGPLGPSAWKYLLQYTLSHGRKNELGRFTDGYKNVQDDWEYLQRHIADNNAEEQNPFKERLLRLRDDWETAMKKMLLRRGQRESFGKEGTAMVSIPQPRYETQALDVPGPDTREGSSLVDVFREIRGLMENDEDEETRAQSQRAFLNKHLKSNTPSVIPAINLLLWTSTFPRVAVYWTNPDRKPYLRTKTGLQGLATAFSTAVLDPTLANRTREAIQEELKKSPFWSNTVQLRDSSPKMLRLIDLINKELVGSRLNQRPIPEQKDEGPEDGSYVRHMLVFARMPITAYLTALILFKWLGDHVDVFLVHSNLPPYSKTKKTPWHSRSRLEEIFNEPCTRDSKNKVTVITYELGAVGWNLQRASMAVLLDVPANAEERTQACNRVNRRGQRCKPQIVEMYYRNHLGEDQRKRMNDGIVDVEEIDWEKYGMVIKKDKGKQPEKEGNNSKEGGSGNGNGDENADAKESDVEMNDGNGDGNDTSDASVIMLDSGPSS